MADQVEVYGLTFADIEIPGVDSSRIGTDTAVTQDDLSGYITDGASQINGAMTKAGLSTSGIDVNTKQQLREAIKAYAQARALERLGIMGERYRNSMERYNTRLNMILDRPQSLTAEVSQTLSNVDTNPTTRLQRRFPKDYKW